MLAMQETYVNSDYQVVRPLDYEATWNQPSPLPWETPLPVPRRTFSGWYQKMSATITSGPEADEWLDHLKGFTELEDGWDDDDAPSPGLWAIDQARSLIVGMVAAGYEPNCLDPWAMGGVGITVRSGNRYAWITLSNNQTVCVLFNTDKGKPKTKMVDPSEAAFAELAADIREFLRG